MESLRRAALALIFFLIFDHGCSQIVCEFNEIKFNILTNSNISLQSCNVTNICCSSFEQHENITAISFTSDSKISYIPNQIYLTLPNLRIFNASKNVINEIIKSNFVKLNYLEVIDLSYNLLERIPKNVFDDSLALRMIHLGEITSSSYTLRFIHSQCVTS